MTPLEVAYKKGYRVNAIGQVISPFSGRPLKLQLQKKGTGYYKFSIKDYENKKYNIDVHRLMAFQKYGKKVLEKGIVVRHSNSNSLDNSWDNLILGTHTDNMNDIPKEQRMASALKASSALKKYHDADVIKMRKDRESGYSYMHIMKKYGVTSKGTLYYILNKRILCESFA